MINRKTHKALAIARYFLSIPDDDAGELVSNLKLQKLLYYAQGYAVAFDGIEKPIFSDKIYAWKHGPVIKTVYNHYAKYVASAIPREAPPKNLTSDDRALLDEVYRVYGRYSAWALRDMTHKEPPWLNNYKVDEMDIEIQLKDLREFFINSVECNE